MRKRRVIPLLLTGLLLLGLLPGAGAADAEPPQSVTILFTHDMHSRLLSAVDETGRSYGGYARLKTAIDQQKAIHPDALLVDGGDFSMGSLFQAVYATDAAELRVMGDLGFDAATFGNHEFDYRAGGLANMLNAAAASGDPLPALVMANYKPPVSGGEGYTQDSQAVWDAYAGYGVQEYTVIQRGGVNFAVFGLMGKDSHAVAPMSGMILEDPLQAARRVVEQIQREVPEPRVVVCLSHSGTDQDPDQSEDELLAAEVEGIHVIVSGHTHTTLTEPIQINGTCIVSAGEYCRNLGVLTLTPDGDGFSLSEYRLVPIDDTLAEDPAIAARVEDYKGLVEESYLTQFGGLTFDQVLAENPWAFDTVTDLYANHRESALGNLIADSYRWAVRQAEGENYVPVDFALSAAGVIRDTLPQGQVTVSDVFNISSLGIGPDQVPGYPLVSVWLTGKDLKNALEVDASVTPIMPAAQLYYTGVTMTFNPHRMLFDRVTHAAQVLEDGTQVSIQDDKLYRVVTGLYCGQMLGTIKAQSFGLLNITPRDAQGREIADIEDFILHDRDGREIKEWYALASYLEAMGTVDEAYSSPQGRKVADESWNPVQLLRDPGPITLAVMVIGAALILGVTLLARFILRRSKKRSKGNNV